MPLIFADTGEKSIIQKIRGGQEAKAHLETLGFVTGGAVTIIHAAGGSVIVNVKESRIAISREMAQNIIVYPCCRDRKTDAYAHKKKIG